jgi:hypothetical protein
MSDLIITEDWASQWWRLNTLYTIITDEGKKIPFKPNPEQKRIYDNLWYWNLIPKARQHGITTFTSMLALDQAIFTPHYSALIIAHSLDDAAKIFRTKVKLAWDELPRALRMQVGEEALNLSELRLGNGSSVAVDTSGRSGTIQFLHVSEFGKICAKYPEKAREIVTGTIPALVKGGLQFVESTAEGAEGYFHDMVMKARAAQLEKRPLTELDYRLHFVPWWAKATNVLDPVMVKITPEQTRYFDTLAGKHRINLSPDQKAWYQKTADSLGDDMKREHPSYLDECFEQSIDGAVLAQEMAWLRREGRIGDFPYDPGSAVNTFWDIRGNTGIWLHQRIRGRNRLIEYYQGDFEGVAHYVNWLNSKGYTFAMHYLPHDATARFQGEQNAQTFAQMLGDLGMRNQTVVPRVKLKKTGIDALRLFLKTCEFDSTGCSFGLKCLDGYKRRFNERLGRYSDDPVDDWASHATDAIRQAAQGYTPPADGAEFTPYRGHRAV